MMFLWGCFCEDQAELLCFFLLTWDVRGTKELRILDASGMCPGLAVCYLATFLTTCVPNATLLQTESFRIPSTILNPHLTPCLVFLQTDELERKNCRSRRTQQPFVLLSVFFAHLEIPEDHWKLHWVQTVCSVYSYTTWFQTFISCGWNCVRKTHRNLGRRSSKESDIRVRFWTSFRIFLTSYM
jgi:hypothetical protein